MLDLNNLSKENLERIQKVLKIILDELEIQEINRLVGNKIPLKRFEKEDIFYDEVISILNKINNEEEKSVLEISNVLLYEGSKDWDSIQQSLKELERFENEKIGLEFLGFSKKDLKENIILRIENLDRLKEIKEDIDKKLREVAITRAKEVRRQFEELNEKQKAFEELGKQISSRTQKDFSAPFQYLKYYEEISKKISEQLAPLKDALERVGRAQQTVKISLTPALQRLAPSLKQLEEQIKNFNELYKAPDHSLSEAIISPDLIRVRQGAEMISELREVRKLIEKSAITKGEPIPIKGEIKIEGLKEGLAAIAKTKKEEDKNKFPYKLPAGTVWENIIFQFLNDENVFIKVGQHKHYTNYKEIGLVGKGKNPNPSELWTFLKVLALENGEIPIDNLKRETKYKKQKELLSKFLQSYFGINLDPFYPYKPYPPYKHERSYKIRMTLIPPPQSAKKQNDFNKEDKNDLGIEEDYKQQTPEIYDKNQ